MTKPLGDETDGIKQWGLDLDNKLVVYTETAEKLTNLIDNDQLSKQQAEHDKEVKRREHLANVELEIREKFNKLSVPEAAEPPTNIKAHVKLPKLQIATFKQDMVDFNWFLNTFLEEVDKAAIPQTTKFSYLKTYVGPKVRAQIDGLPFSTEGYTRAKNILNTKYGRPSEIVNAHITAIMNLPLIKGGNPHNIAGFYETLVRNLQALETMGKLESVNGYTRMLLDRLPNIRSELVRNDSNWHDWKLPDLVAAIRKWTDRNPVKFNKSRGNKQ